MALAAERRRKAKALEDAGAALSVKLNARSTRGQRITELQGEDAEADETFWGQHAWQEAEEEDSEFSSEEGSSCTNHAREGTCYHILQISFYRYRQVRLLTAPNSVELVRLVFAVGPSPTDSHVWSLPDHLRPFATALVPRRVIQRSQISSIMTSTTVRARMMTMIVRRKRR